MSYWTHIGRIIHRMRTSQNMTQQDLGDKIGASRQFVSNLENGSKKCSIDLLVKIAEALGCYLDITLTPQK